ncbi:MAG: carbamate kinase [Clostridiaceae bacterium]
MGKRLVLALGGNALGNTPDEQIAAVKITAASIVDLILQGNEIILSHGNGPQVGMINLAFDAASGTEVKTPSMPLPECGAMSQGYIGFHLQNAIINEMKMRGMTKDVITLVTEVLVDKDDPAFSDPTKPIGRFYKEEETEELRAKGFVVKEDAGRGYRRVVASPKPLRIIGIKAIESLVGAGAVVIAAGGGGIPMIEENGQFSSIAAVIDKDFTSEKLAEQVNADVFIVLTAVDKVAIRFGKPEVEWLSSLTPAKATEYINNNEFAKGSMLPKVQAALAFVESKPGRRALITSLEKAKEALEGKTGTWIES